MNLLKGTLFLKIAALVCAIFAYIMIHNEINDTEKEVHDPSYKLIKLTAKNLPLKVRLATSPPEGYRVVADKVVSNPSQVIVVGPQALLEEASTAETALVDTSQSTTTFTRRIPVESVAGIHVTGDPYTVEVTVPIEKLEAAKSS